MGECVTVFLGSSSGTKPLYEQVARSVGAEFARNKVTIVYGGGQSGCTCPDRSSLLAHAHEDHSRHGRVM